MKDSYDYSKSVKNPYLRKPKKQLTIRLDEDTIDYFRSLAGQSGIPYQSLINLYLRDCVVVLPLFRQLCRILDGPSKPVRSGKGTGPAG